MAQPFSDERAEADPALRQPGQLPGFRPRAGGASAPAIAAVIVLGAIALFYVLFGMNNKTRRADAIEVPDTSQNYRPMPLPPKPIVTASAPVGQPLLAKAGPSTEEQDAKARAEAARAAREAERLRVLTERLQRLRAPLMVEEGGTPVAQRVSLSAPVAAGGANQGLQPPLPSGIPGLAGLQAAAQGGVLAGAGQLAQALGLGQGGAAAQGVQGVQGVQGANASGGASPASATASAAAVSPRFIDQASARRTSRVAVASPEPQIEYKILEGKLISAVLETGVNTDLPGNLRAMVDEDVYAERGRFVLIPRMTRLIGEYENSIRNGQSRVLVVWRRAILPDGISIDLGSYGSDSLGRAGMAGDVNNHFMQRFGNAALVSIVGAAATERALGNSANAIVGATAGVATVRDIYRDEIASSMRSVVQSILAENQHIPPTIRVDQGSRIRIFVAKDLDFSALAPADGSPMVR